LQTDLVFFKKCEITQLGFATLCSTQSTNSCKRRNELRDYKHHNSNNAYSLSHKSLNTVPYTGSTFIVGAGPGECQKAFGPLIWCPPIVSTYERDGEAQRPRPTNDL